MASTAKSGPAAAGFRLNYKRIIIISLAFFGILLLWQVYNSYCSPMLSDLFADAMGLDVSNEKSEAYIQVQYLVGIVMAIDNIAAFFLLPIFGRLSDKTHTKIGKRMPYILVGTVVSAIAFPFIPLLYYYNNLIGMIAIMAVVVIFMMMYRNPAVALMPDVTPKPLRSRANAIINTIGFVGGILGSGLAMFLQFTDFQDSGNLWIIMTPFLVASVLMIITCLILFFCFNENKIAEEVAPELERGEKYSETLDEVSDDAPMTKSNKKTLWLILAAEVLWFMAFNAVETFITNYGIFYLGVESGDVSTGTIILSLTSFVAFMAGGFVSEKIGRKWTIVIGLALIFAALFWAIFINPTYVYKTDSTYYTFPVAFYFVFVIAGIGWAFINVCSFPMVVELCSKEHVGKFTGYYYAASMLAQSITPILIGGILTMTGEWKVLMIYSTVLMGLSLIVFLFVKTPKVKDLGHREDKPHEIQVQDVL